VPATMEAARDGGAFVAYLMLVALRYGAFSVLSGNDTEPSAKPGSGQIPLYNGRTGVISTRGRRKQTGAKPAAGHTDEPTSDAETLEPGTEGFEYLQAMYIFNFRVLARYPNDTELHDLAQACQCPEAVVRNSYDGLLAYWLRQRVTCARAAITVLSLLLFVAVLGAILGLQTTKFWWALTWAQVLASSTSIDFFHVYLGSPQSLARLPWACVLEIGIAVALLAYDWSGVPLASLSLAYLLACLLRDAYNLQQTSGLDPVDANAP